LSIYEARNVQDSGTYFLFKNRRLGCREFVSYSDYPVKAQKPTQRWKGADDMKYILLMAGAKAGVDAYKEWSEKDIQTHFAHLKRLNKDLKESGEFVANEGLAAPEQAKLVRAGNNGTPITDGVFPEAKEFLLGYWMVDVENPERAYEIASRLSAGPGPGGIPLSMPIEVRQIMSHGTEELP
jgi:hypothetical protein